MGNAERIIEFLEHKNEGYDDDKLSIELKIQTRQQVNQICNRLASRNQIIREKYHGKIHNFPNNENWRFYFGSKKPNGGDILETTTLTSSTTENIDEITSNIREIYHLFKDGLITKEEFEKKKNELKRLL